MLQSVVMGALTSIERSSNIIFTTSHCYASQSPTATERSSCVIFCIRSSRITFSMNHILQHSTCPTHHMPHTLYSSHIIFPTHHIPHTSYSQMYRSITCHILQHSTYPTHHISHVLQFPHIIFNLHHFLYIIISAPINYMALTRVA